MKKLLLIVAVLSLALPSLPAAAQEPTEYKIYLPVATKNYCGEIPMPYWKVIIPQGTTNTVLNPSAETTGNFAAEAGTTVTRVTTYSKWGLYSYRVQCNANNEGIRITTDSLANAIHYATVRVRGTLPAAWDWSMDNANWHTPTLIESLDADWDLYGVQLPAAQCNGQTTFRIHQNGAGAGDFYIDGIQIEELEYWTVYCDGDQEGCEWNGAEHASTSQRSAQSRAGGRVRDLQDDYSLDVGGMVGAGVAPLSLAADEYAILPGGEVSGSKTHMHPFTLTGVIRGTSYADLHAKRQALVLLFDPDGVPPDADGPQPVRLRYTGATVEKQIAVHYEGGLEGAIRATEPCWWERMAIRFLADDPYWYEIGESAQLLDSNDTANVFRAVGRLRSTGQWDNLGLAADVGAGSGVWAVLAASDGSIYVAGEFTNFGGVAGRDYVARYVPSTGTWETVGALLDFTDIIECLAEGPDGRIYAGGQFTIAGGDPADYLAQYNPATNTWGVVAAGGTGIVYALAFDGAGLLYIGGFFNNWAGLGVNNIVKWDGAVYSSVGGVSASATVRALRSDPLAGPNVVYAGGAFATIGAVTVNGTARWDGTAWTALGSGINIPQTVYDIAVGPDGRIYFVGSFTTAGGITVNYAAVWNGTAWNGLAGGFNGEMRGVEIADDGMAWVVGIATATTSGVVIDRIARWNGSSWSPTDVNLPGADVIGQHVIAITRYDPVVETNYDVYLGLQNAGAAYFAGSATATNDGTESVYPVIAVERSGANTARLVSVRNETTGKELLFDYSLLDGERLTVDLTPTEKSILSNFFGDRLDAVLAGCDFGTFALQPGANNITCFVDVGGAVTVTAYLLFQDKYNGYD